MYRASRGEVVEHFAQGRRGRAAGDDLQQPDRHQGRPRRPTWSPSSPQIENIVAVKEFSGDVRRAFEISELCDIQVIAGADDLLFELLVDGATGWFAGFPNTFPAESVEIYDLVQAGRIDEARTLYKYLVAAFRWDSRTEFVQAIKLGMDMVGRYGGPCRPPRGPLTAEHGAAGARRHAARDRPSRGRRTARPAGTSSAA